jgi:hypothetical protein
MGEDTINGEISLVYLLGFYLNVIHYWVDLIHSIRRVVLKVQKLL